MPFFCTTSSSDSQIEGSYHASVQIDITDSSIVFAYSASHVSEFELDITNFPNNNELDFSTVSLLPKQVKIKSSKPLNPLYTYK